MLGMRQTVNPAVAKKIPEINAIMIPRQGIFLILAMTGSSSSLSSSTLFCLETLLVEISQFGKLEFGIVGIRKVRIRKVAIRQVGVRYFDFRHSRIRRVVNCRIGRY